MLRWAELSVYPDRKRFEALSAVLNEAGFQNEVSFIESDETQFADALKEAQKEFAQLRIGGELCHMAHLSADRMSTLMFALKTADAYAQMKSDGTYVRTQEESGADGATWWPKNYLTEGIRRVLVADLKAVDFSGGVFVLGAGAEARSAVAALARTGFVRFSISDPNEELGLAFIEEAEKVFFNCKFQFVPRHMITQLPSVNSIAINTLVRGRDGGALDELFYFNFLKSGGIWLDLPFERHDELDSEALAVGASIASGYRILAWSDFEWAKEVLGVDLSIDKLTEAYKNA